MTTKPSALLSFLSFLILLAALGAAAGGYGVYEYLRPGPLEEPKIVLIERGLGVGAIAEKLNAENVVESPFLFKVAARLSGGSLKAGEYEFFARAPMAEILRKMEEGEVYDRKFTVREGLTSWQVVQIVKGVEDLEGEVADIPPEGSLLPETYHFIKGDTRAGKIGEMRAAMTAAIDELWEGRAADLPFTTKEEALTLASIVEKETSVADERARIAGVFVNRLKRGIALQTDPTVIYAITKGVMKDEGKGPLGRRLLTKDMEIDSPYNTYKYPGLPPGPIANPGRASIEAVLHPEEHDFIYFVADGTGGHVFAKTLAEHNANVAKWRKIRNSQ